MRGQVLLVEDDQALRGILERRLAKAGFVLSAHSNTAAALAALEDFDAEAVLTDIHLEGGDGLAFCQQLAARQPDLPVVVMTAFGSMERAVEAIRVGAYDFLTKPLELEAAVISLDRAVEHHRLRQEVRRLRRQARQAPSFDELVGESGPMRALYRMLERVAAAPSSVLIVGESGTGKERVASAIHRRSPRREQPFVAINCAALPESLLESELFGHARGAFTGAQRSRPGLFVQATGGTLFLDEIGDMPLSLQPKLLRALQERRIRPVGSDEEQEVDVRLVAATHRDLEGLVEEGRFRADLLYRLDVIRLDLPPLRDRGTDVLLLAQRFVKHFSERLEKPVSGITPEAAARLMDYSWPGNVRELQNCIERAVVLTAYDQLTVEDLPRRIQTHTPSRHVIATTDDPSALLPMHEVERRYILRVLEAVQGNKATASRILQLDRKTLYRKLKQYGAVDGDE